MFVYGNSLQRYFRKSVIASFQRLDWKFNFAHKFLFCYEGLFESQLKWEKKTSRQAASLWGDFVPVDWISETECHLIVGSLLNLAAFFQHTIVYKGIIVETNQSYIVFRRLYQRWKNWIIITNLYVFTRTRSSFYCFHTYNFFLWLCPKFFFFSRFFHEL